MANGTTCGLGGLAGAQVHATCLLTGICGRKRGLVFVATWESAEAWFSGKYPEHTHTRIQHRCVLSSMLLETSLVGTVFLLKS